MNEISRWMKLNKALVIKHYCMYWLAHNGRIQHQELHKWKLPAAQKNLSTCDTHSFSLLSSWTASSCSKRSLVSPVGSAPPPAELRPPLQQWCNRGCALEGSGRVLVKRGECENVCKLGSWPVINPLHTPSDAIHQSRIAPLNWPSAQHTATLKWILWVVPCRLYIQAMKP